MSMTRDEAILLSAYTGFLLVPDFSEVHKFCEDALGHPIFTHEFADRDVQKEIQEKLRSQIMELIQNIAALRFPTREMVERMRFPWERIADAYGNTEGFLCECGHMDNSASNFCRYCGLPKTDEAVDILWQRWKEALGDEN